MNAAATLLLMDIVSPRRASRVCRKPEEQQISAGERFMSPEEPDERKTHDDPRT